MRLLAYTSPARGHLYPVVPILLELLGREHDISLSALTCEVHTTRAVGIDTQPLSARVEAIELDDYRSRSPVDRGRRALATFAARAEAEVPDMRAAIDRHRPDALLIDVNCWGAATVAEASGMPWVVYSPYLLMTPSREAPPFGLGLAPMDGRLGRARDGLLRTVGEAVANRAVLPALNPPARRTWLGAAASRQRPGQASGSAACADGGGL